ncbi:hypothetical protein ACFOS2_06425, partial [Bacillus chungangensis]|uniref:hypothetical protein n=1 Tax=Bacillus chungangensis TaxID=587633 RepID=UPI00361611A0
MNGLYVFFIAMIIAIIIFYFFSRYLSKKYPHRATYLWPPILLTVCASIVSPIFLFRKRWLGNDELLFFYYIDCSWSIYRNIHSQI